jgi:hypothetical protein
MTVHQHIKARLTEQCFNSAQSKAIIATCLALDRAREFRKYWDGEMSLMPSAVIPKFEQQVDAIARAWRQTFDSKSSEPALPA